MPRSCNERSRSYPGRPARRAVQLTLDSVLHGNMQDDQAGVSRGHSSSPPANEGPNPRKGNGPASSAPTTNPTGGVDGRRVAGKPDPDEHLLEQILSRENMLSAWQRVKANKGAPGIDKMPIDDFMAYAREHWEEMMDKRAQRTEITLCPRALGGDSLVTFCRQLPTLAGQAGGDRETNGRLPPAGDSHRP